MERCGHVGTRPSPGGVLRSGGGHLWACEPKAALHMLGSARWDEVSPSSAFTHSSVVYSVCPHA